MEMSLTVVGHVDKMYQFQCITTAPSRPGDSLKPFDRDRKARVNSQEEVTPQKAFPRIPTKQQH